jgi:Bardet-Biedl syndrome 1 protein
MFWLKISRSNRSPKTSLLSVVPFLNNLSVQLCVVFEKMAEEEANKSKTGIVWLNAWHDPVANIKAFSQHIDLADLYGDGDHKLLIADIDKKLKVFKGTSIVSEHVLLEIPVALCCFYMDQNNPPSPAVAVASGANIFIYKNLKPYYKFSLPPLHVENLEIEVWNDLKADKIGLLLVMRCW